MKLLKSFKTTLFFISLVIQLISYFMPWLRFFLEPRTGTQIQGGWAILVYIAVALVATFYLKKIGIWAIAFLSSLPIVFTTGSAIYLGFFPTTGLFLAGLWTCLGCFLYQLIYCLIALFTDQENL